MISEKENCIIMAIGWPNTWSKGAEKIFTWSYNNGIIKDRYFKVGHAAMCLIHKETKEVLYFDFGRYTCDKGQGRARGKNTDPKLTIQTKATFDAQGKVTNLQEIVNDLFNIVAYTHGEGVIYFSMYDKMNFEKTIQFIDNIQQQGSVRYTTFSPNSTNCSRFVAGAIMAGGTNWKDKVKLFFTPTLRASPVGTVVDVGYQSNVYRQENINSPLENFSMKRADYIKLLYDNIKGNFVGEKVERPDLIDAKIRPENVPHTATWLGGLGEGNWIYISPLIQPHSYRARAYYHDGTANYDIIVEDKTQSFDINKPYLITYDCSRLFVTTVQNNKRFLLRLIKDYE